jgi:hypothetical protein
LLVNHTLSCISGQKHKRIQCADSPLPTALVVSSCIIGYQNACLNLIGDFLRANDLKISGHRFRKNWYGRSGGISKSEEGR